MSVTSHCFSRINFPKITYNVFICDSENYMYLRAWYRSQKPLNPENPKKLRKKKKKRNPPPRVGPRKYEKNTEKIQKSPKNNHFCIFSVFFSYFRGPTRGGGFRIFFFVIFSYFRDSGVSGICTRPAGVAIHGQFLWELFLGKSHFSYIKHCSVNGEIVL